MVGMVCVERSSESNRKKKKRRLPHPCTTRKSGAPTERNRRQNPNGCPTRLSLSAPGHSANRALLLSQALFWDEFCAFITYSTPAVVCRALPHSFGASRHRTFPQLNLHRPASAATTGGFLLTALSKARRSTALVHTFFLKARLR